MQRSVKVSVRRGEQFFVAECADIPVITQGQTLDETIANIREAVALFFEDESPAEHGFAENPSLLIVMEVEPLAHAG